MRLDPKRLRRPEWLLGAAGLVLIASMVLLPWFTVTSASPPPGPRFFVKSSIDGWHGLTGARWLILVTVLLAVAAAFFQARQRAPAIPATLALLASVFGGLSSIWLIYRVLISPPGGSAKLGAFIGLISALVIAYAGHGSVRLEGIAPRDAPDAIPTVSLGEQGRT